MTRRSLFVVAVTTGASAVAVACSGASSAGETVMTEAPATTLEPTTTQQLRHLEAGRYRLSRLPVVEFERADDGGKRGIALQALVRLNRALPAAGSRAQFAIQSSGLDASPQIFGQRERHCYVGTLPNDEGVPDILKAPQDGQVVPFTIDIVGEPADFHVNVWLRRSGPAAEAADRAMGCGKGGIADDRG